MASVAIECKRQHSPVYISGRTRSVRISKDVELYASWCVSGSMDGVSWRGREATLLGHLFRYAPYKLGRFIGGQRVLKQGLKIVPVLGNQIATRDHGRERPPPCVDIEHVRQPSVKFREGERA